MILNCIRIDTFSLKISFVKYLAFVIIVVGCSIKEKNNGNHFFQANKLTQYRSLLEWMNHSTDKCDENSFFLLLLFCLHFYKLIYKSTHTQFCFVSNSIKSNEIKNK